MRAGAVEIRALRSPARRRRPDFAATGREWRTAPLWGVDLAQVIQAPAAFLHDNRARTLEEAIL